MSIGADFPEGSAVRIWTIGHSRDARPDFLDRLRAFEIDTVVDVRSRPGSKWAPQFNREALEEALAARGIGYVWQGDKLGGMPEDERFYDSAGYTLYEPLAAEEWFMKAIGWLEFEAQHKRLALTCVEEPPEDCHRHVLLARVLGQRGAKVDHIRRDRSIETHEQVEHRLGRDQASLFDEIWRSPKPMRPG